MFCSKLPIMEGNIHRNIYGNTFLLYIYTIQHCFLRYMRIIAKILQNYKDKQNSFTFNTARNVIISFFLSFSCDSSTGSVMAEARPEAGIHWELHKKLQEAVQQGAATKVKSLLKGFSKDEAREILNYWSSRKTVPLIVLAIRSRHEKVVRFLVNDYDVRVDRITFSRRC